MLYTVVSYRWGYTNEQVNEAAATLDLQRACKLAEELADNGAGKHGVAVYEWREDTTRHLHKYIPSTYGESEPYHNPRIDMFQSIGHAAHSAVTTGALWEAQSSGQPGVPRPALVPEWLTQLVRAKAVDSEFSVRMLRAREQRNAEGLPPLAFGDRAVLDAAWEAARQEVDAQLAAVPKQFRAMVLSREQQFGPIPPDTSPRAVLLKLDYLPLEALLALVDDPARTVCQRIVTDHRERFEQAPGSRHNHQAWPGGYIDHVVDGMNYARHLYAFDTALGRPMPFALSDALLVFFLHDLEKPWRILARADGTLTNGEGFDTKAHFKAFREKKLTEYGLKLTPVQANALTYVEGEGDAYSSSARIMNELAAFCHKVDIWSARQCYDYPKAEGDEWSGAGRFRRVS